MTVNKNKPSIESIFADLYHQNPNINKYAFSNMKKFWPEESINRLIKNLDVDNIQTRRKSVKALAYFGKDVVKLILSLYISNQKKIIRIGCLKILVLIASNHTLDEFRDDLHNIVKLAINDDSVEIILSTISLLRQLGEPSIPFLQDLCRDKNVLKAKASLTALLEIHDFSDNSFLKEIADDSLLDPLIREAAFDALSF